MIKLIVSDIDGTLIGEHSSNELSERIFELIQRCNHRGIQFAVASGRSYSNLKTLFLPVWRDIYFFADNGNLTMFDNNLIHSLPIPLSLVQEVSETIINYDDCAMCFSTNEKTLALDKPAWLLETLVYKNKSATMLVDSLNEVYEEQVIKISLMVDLSSLEKRHAEFQERWGDQLLITKSGSGWVDISLSGKGAAIRRVMDDRGINADETMVFGDNFNDIEMFQVSNHSYAMSGAADEVRSHAAYTATVVEDIIEHYINTGEILNK